MSSAYKHSRIIDSDETEAITMSEESADEFKKTEKPKTVKKAPVKKGAAVPRTPRQAPKRRKNQMNDAAGEALKTLLCQWAQDEDCMKKILEGKKIAFVPVFL